MLKTERFTPKKAFDELSFARQNSLHKCIKLFVSSKVEFRHNTRCQRSIKGKMMKKLMLTLAPVVLALTACATTTGTGTGAASAQTTTQQLGVAALKVAVNAKCITEINNVAAWKTATKYMTAEQRDSIQTNVCGCVSEKAPNSVTAVELAAAALDVNTRATIVNQVVSKTVNACVAEALQK